jgi:hypothetical protein
MRQAMRLDRLEALEVEQGSISRVQAGSRSTTAAISARNPLPIPGSPRSAARKASAIKSAETVLLASRKAMR